MKCHHCDYPYAYRLRNDVATIYCPNCKNEESSEDYRRMEFGIAADKE